MTTRFSLALQQYVPRAGSLDAVGDGSVVASARVYSAQAIARHTALCALLDPDCYVQPAGLRDAFSYAIPADKTVFVPWAWNTSLNGAGRWEIRNPDHPAAIRGVTLAGLGSGAYAGIIDPSLVAYADPVSLYYSRIAALNTLPTKVINFDGIGNGATGDANAYFRKPWLPGPYGMMLRSINCFNYLGIIGISQLNYGINFQNERGDIGSADYIRFANTDLAVPFTKAQINEAWALDSGGVGGPNGAIAYNQLPSTWSTLADPLAPYLFRDDFTGASLDTAVWTRAQTTGGNVEINTDFSWCKCRGDATGWSNGAYVTNGRARASAGRMVADIYLPVGEGVGAAGAFVGWIGTAGIGVNNFAHALFFAPGTGLLVFEDGNNRGSVGTGCQEHCNYRVRITPLSGDGATYEVQGGTEYAPLGGSVWTNVTPGTSSSSASALYPGFMAFPAADCYVGDVRVY
jgi:hypothetical protein